MQGRVALLLCSAFVLGYARPQSNGGDAGGQMHTMELVDPNPNGAAVSQLGPVGAGGNPGQNDPHTMYAMGGPQGNVRPLPAFDNAGSGSVGMPAGAPGGGVAGPQMSAQFRLQKFRTILVAYFPDTWVAAWDAIPDATKLCLMSAQQEAMRAVQRQQADPRTAFAQSQQQCPQDQDKVQAFGKAIEDSFNALPDKLKQIGKTLCDKISAAQGELQKGNLHPLFAAMSEFLEALKALTQQDREDIAKVFPKLRNLITATEINDIFDGGDKMVLGLGEIVAAIQSLAQKL